MLKRSHIVHLIVLFKLTAIAVFHTLICFSSERLRELAGLDFTAAVEVWEYKMCKDVNAFGNEDVFELLSKVSEAKLKAAVLGSPVLSKLIYGVSPLSCTGANLPFVASLVVGSKISEAEEILRNVKNNATGDFSDRMKAIVDSVFELSMGKTGSKKATLNHKQTILLFDFVSKMKTGATKNLLTQRLKEL
ncbi:MAG: hypothetical protein FWB95_01425 [Treponema sp.]|nr:hypothetical protein [Treponema sp.]